MEEVEEESPFKSPNPTSRRPPRSSPGSGSSTSSLEKESPLRLLTNVVHNHHHHIQQTGEDIESKGLAVAEDGVRVNPFEKDVLAGLQRSFWSPSIMEIKETPPKRAWAIEHLSHLFPKDIENSPSTHQNAFPVDPQTEAKAQADIDRYFSRDSIVPTPSPLKQNGSSLNFLESATTRLNKQTILYSHCSQSPIARAAGGTIGCNNGGLILKKKKVVPVIERWAQTEMSFPPNLPLHIEEMLKQYCQMTDLCGSSGEPAGLVLSQKSEGSDYADGIDSSSLNGSIRRRLELSFGEDPDGEDADQPSDPRSPVVDPFRLNHLVKTPPGSAMLSINTTTSEIELQLMRCEFTPETRGMIAVTPGITPIHDDPEDARSAAFLTPRRNATTAKRIIVKEPLFPPTESPMQEEYEITSKQSVPRDCALPGAGSLPQLNLRRSRTSSPNANMKTSSASSFDDSRLMDADDSPPSKVYRRNSNDS